MGPNDWIVLTYCISIFVMVSYAIFAVVYTKVYLVNDGITKGTEGFITARKSQNMWRVGWSFFACQVGAWCLVVPSIYATSFGIVGLVAFAVAQGISLWAIAILGKVVQESFPKARSFSDYVMERFGPTAKLFITLLTLFNMSIGMLAEYTTIGSIYQGFVGSVNYGIMIVVGVLTTIYTMYGGLLVSIVTDQVQAIVSIIMILVLCIYVAVAFRPPAGLPSDFGVNSAIIGPSTLGYSEIFVMPYSVTVFCVFNEAMWQRSWAAESRSAAIAGGGIAFVATTVAVFVFGFSAFLSAWANMIDFDPTSPTFTDPNLYFFQIFGNQNPINSTQTSSSSVSGNPAQATSWVGVFIVILANIMNESGIDSYQNGIAATITVHFLKGKSIAYARAVVLLINIPIIAFALDNYTVTALFLVTNIVCACCVVPVLAGIWNSPAGRLLVTESAMLFACLVSFLTVLAYGIGNFWVPGDPSQSFANGAAFAFYIQNYQWDYFLVALGSSCVGLVLWIAVAQALRRGLGFEGVGISALLLHVPGFRYLAGDYDHDTDDSSVEQRPSLEEKVSVAKVGSSEDVGTSSDGSESGVEILPPGGFNDVAVVPAVAATAGAAAPFHYMSDVTWIHSMPTEQLYPPMAGYPVPVLLPMQLGAEFSA